MVSRRLNGIRRRLNGDGRSVALSCCGRCERQRWVLWRLRLSEESDKGDVSLQVQGLAARGSGWSGWQACERYVWCLAKGTGNLSLGSAVRIARVSKSAGAEVMAHLYFPRSCRHICQLVAKVRCALTLAILVSYLMTHRKPDSVRSLHT